MEIKNIFQEIKNVFQNKSVTTGSNNAETAKKLVTDSAKTSEDSIVQVENIIDDVQIESIIENLKFYKQEKTTDTKQEDQNIASLEQYAQEAYNGLEYIHNEIWDNFPEMYNITKDWDNYQDYYNPSYGYYGTISEIAAEKSEPWKNVKTKEDAMHLMSDVLKTATNDSSSYKRKIDSKNDINTGEMGVINKVLDELEKINDDTKAIAAIYREELEKAEEESAAWIDKNSIELQLKREKYVSGLKMNKSLIQEQAKEIENAKTEYEAAKADFLKNKYTGEEKTEKAKELESKLSNFYGACNSQICTYYNLYNASDPNMAIVSDYAKEAIKNAETRVNKLLKSTQTKTPVNKTPQPLEPKNAPTETSPASGENETTTDTSALTGIPKETGTPERTNSTRDEAPGELGPTQHQDGYWP